MSDLTEKPSPTQSMMLLGGILIAFYVFGVLAIGVFSWELPRGTQAVVFATVLGSVGTLLLAIATFTTVLQTSRQLNIREKERERPLAVDELSHIIQPALTALENNLEQLDNSENPGCAFDWVYIDEPTLYAGTRGPEPVRTPDSLPLARLARENRTLFGSLRAHNEYVQDIGRKAQQLHSELNPELERLFEEAGVNREDRETIVVTSAVLKEIEHFGEHHELYEFWNTHREHLIEYANEEITVTLDEIQSGERVYREFVTDTLSDLKQRKFHLKHEYSISENDISETSESDIWDLDIKR
jgi:hypothetical protein